LFQDWPNFAPVAAISLFAGYASRSPWRAAWLAPAIMLLSDCVIGFYRPATMFSVYAMLTLPVVAGMFLKSRLSFHEPGVGRNLLSFAGLVTSSLAASVSFFLVTNFVMWWDYSLYSADLAGLTRCYVSALPFFRNTLCGDLAFSCLMFGSYGIASQFLLLSSRPQAGAAALARLR
jgi:hypothetical protein